MLVIKTIFIFIGITFIFGCDISTIQEEKNVQNIDEKNITLNAIAPIIIYKTNGDYANLVPVQLSSDKTEITGFPDVQDIYIGDEFAYPTILEQGYLLDNRGVDDGTAFTDITYEMYAKFLEIPSSEYLLQHVAYTNPFIEMYDCNNTLSMDDTKEDINNFINTGQLKSCNYFDFAQNKWILKNIK